VLVYVLNFVDRQIISILANDIKADLGLTDAELGFFYGTAFGVFYALFGIPLGRLADSWSRVRLLSIGLVVWSGMTALSGFTRNGIELGAVRAGVGIGEATASPTAYSLISDWFPKRMRGLALAIYSSGLYLCGGISLFIGGLIVKKWNDAYPGGGPFDLVGWQAAFLAVGIPGLLVAGLVATLREPTRGLSDGLIMPPPERPFRGFVDELFAVIPPFTLFNAARRGTAALLNNVGALTAIGGLCALLAYFTGNWMQWGWVGVGYYAVFSWATSLRLRDPVAFKLIWGTPAFLTTILAYGSVAFASYAVSFWAAPYAERTFGQAKEVIGFWVGGPGALAGFLGVIIGGRVSDILRQRNPAGRLIVIAVGLAMPAPFLLWAFTTTDPTTFYVLHFIMGLFSSSALGAAAATSQELVLPRMRGTATATFFLATTLYALALGPYYVGKVATVTGDLGTGMLALLLIAPLGLAFVWHAYRNVPAAEASLLDRARAAGEPV
jgi:MFS family permease